MHSVFVSVMRALVTPHPVCPVMAKLALLNDVGSTTRQTHTVYVLVLGYAMLLQTRTVCF